MFFRQNKQKNKNQRRKFTTGFTLVETLVAISILMLAVTGPLYYASEALRAATYAKDQITAFYLAQDAFEQIRKIRDENIYSSNNWNNGLIGCQSECLVNASGFCKIDQVQNEDSKFLYINENGVYTHSTSRTTKTIFKRTVTIIPTDGVDGTWDNATEMKVTVKMEWNNHGKREFTAYEFLRNFK